jgi:hypothetical protein
MNHFYTLAKKSAQPNITELKTAFFKQFGFEGTKLEVHHCLVSFVINQLKCDSVELITKINTGPGNDMVLKTILLCMDILRKHIMVKGLQNDTLH